MVELSRITQPTPEPDTAIYVEPWKPWSGHGDDFSSWFRWMSTDKGMSTLIWNMKSVDALNLYQVMNDLVYEIHRKLKDVS